MPPPPKLLLFFAAALLITSTITSFSATQCPRCGSTLVPYPLSTGPTCGDQSYKIRCNSSVLMFDTLNSSYPIISINQTIQRLVIQPAGLLSNTCVTSDFVHQGIQMNSSLPFNITGENTIMFLNCSASLLRSPLNCSENSLCHLYVNSTKSESPCQDAPICCTFQAGGGTTAHMIRVRDVGCMAYTSFVDLDPNSAVDRWPSPGVAIQWVLPREPECVSQADCDGGSTCDSDPNLSVVRRCFCNGGLEWDPVGGSCRRLACQNTGGCTESMSKKALVAGLTCGLGGALLAAFVAIFLYKRHRRSKEAQERLAKHREQILNASGSRAAKHFTGNEIRKATNNFAKDRLLGAGGYGEVYKGILNDGTVVAIKCAKLGNTKGTDQVLNEVRILCQVNHRSLVSLLGCCVELEQPILVYEYIRNGALIDHLQGPKHSQLSWIQRLQIAYDTAEGLSYLHFSAVPPIYHRDVKSSNILLDEKMSAKVSDFGLSRLAHTDLSHISTCAQGTLGYLDPEYYRNYQLTDKSDVYSFGIVLLELLTCMRAIDFTRAEDDVNLAVYARRMADEEKLMEVVDPALKEKASRIQVESIKALGFLALGCLEEKRQNRPSMKEVVEEIEYIMSIAYN